MWPSLGQRSLASSHLHRKAELSPLVKQGGQRLGSFQPPTGHRLGDSSKCCSTSPLSRAHYPLLRSRNSESGTARQCRTWDHLHSSNLWGRVPLTFPAPRAILEPPSSRGGRSQWIPQRSHSAACLRCQIPGSTCRWETWNSLWVGPAVPHCPAVPSTPWQQAEHSRLIMDKHSPDFQELL